MNKKGLTLVELLAVITIMGLIILVVLPSVSTLGEKISQQHYEQAVTLLESAAKVYVEQIDSTGLNNVGDSKQITLQDLVKAKLIESPFINPKTQNQVPLNSIIKIIKKDVNQYDYELPI